ncbi:MAG: alcohol dehydrogenase family protein [Novosphingobium sp.]|uniref:alcohol dehydrogenase family protein n=1 Tax=Novosphingobium sp. TaxID=1874826 RepID=UPI0032BBAC12
MSVPDTMRGVVLTGFGGFDKLEYRIDLPVPRPGPGEVLIKVGAAGVNNTDINTRIGWYSPSVEGSTAAGGSGGFAEAQGEGWSGTQFTFPRIQGIDAAGRIVAVGEGVGQTRIGERVLVEPALRRANGMTDFFGSECDGGFAEYAVAPAAHSHAVRCALSEVELASFPCAYSTAENLLHRSKVAAGERVLVTGASGGVGSAAVQLARRRGAIVTALAGASKHRAVADLGASEVLDRHAPLENNAYDAVIDVVGGSGFGQLLQALRPGGRYASSGAIAGPLVELDLRTLYLKDLTLFGCTALDDGVFASLVGHIERGEVRPVVCATFPLEKIEAAQRVFLEKRHVGKIVLTVDSASPAR